jgi:alpha-ketoglutarate-dependent 2,4-dichlorophenoxyacetate dioxygenase
MTIEIEKLHPLFAARVHGVDIAAGVGEADFAALRAAFEEYSVLVLPHQDIDDDVQMAFSKRFGPLEMMAPHASNNGRAHHIARMHNEEADGAIIPPDDMRMVYQSANQIWHSDSSFKPVPSLCSLLHARLLPPEGGETEFACLRAAYDALDDGLKAFLDGKAATHDFAHTRAVVGGELSEWQKNNLPPVRQAIIRENPVNHRKALFTGGHAVAIDGMAASEGRELLDRLLAHATQDRFVYAHAWSDGDLVIWDNRAVLHRGRPWDVARHKRILHRTTVAGEGPTVAA